MKKTHFINIPKNLHFADSQTGNKSDQAFKMCIAISYLNNVFEDAMSEAER